MQIPARCLAIAKHLKIELSCLEGNLRSLIEEARKELISNQPKTRPGSRIKSLRVLLKLVRVL